MQDQELYDYIKEKLYENGSCTINKLKQIKLPNGKIIKAYVNNKGYIHCYCISNITKTSINKIKITYDHFRFTGKKELVRKNGWDIRYLTIEETKEELLSWGIELNDNNNEGLQKEYYNTQTNEMKTLYQIGYEYLQQMYNDFDHEPHPESFDKQETIDLGKGITEDYQECYELVE